MGSTDAALNQILKDIAPSDETLQATKERRDAVLKAAAGFRGFLRSYKSGSIGHHTANDDTDADCGVVMDRRSRPELGPDGDGVGPNAVVDEMREFIRASLKVDYPDVRFRVTKRAIKISFNEPLPGGTDPTVDLVVALTRKEHQQGLWIPNREQGWWDASHPEKHTELMRSEPAELRRKRAKVVRLAKAWNKEFDQPGLSGFNITALALESVGEEGTLAECLANFFEHASRSLEQRLTPDPAGVSPPIKVMGDRESVVKRLSRAGEKFRHALDNDKDKAEVLSTLGKLYPSCASVDKDAAEREQFAQTLRTGNSGVGVVAGGLASLSGAPDAKPIKTTRAYGGKRRRQFGKRKEGPWYGEDKPRLQFEKDAVQCFPSIRAKTYKKLERCYNLDVEVPSYGVERVSIRFEKEKPKLPKVRALDHPNGSPHRYGDDTLCMWHPGDNRDQVWEFQDGLVSLIGLTIAHLFREAYWRETGEWLGPEAPHDRKG